MLYHKLITLPATCTSQITKPHYNVVSYLIKTSGSCSRFIQLYCTKSRNKKGNENNVKENSSKISSIFHRNVKVLNSTKIIKHLASNINKTDLYIVNHETANNFVALIKDDLLKNLSHVIELNPGLGILTKNLLQAGVPSIELFEKRDEFLPELYKLCKMFPNRLSIKKANLVMISKMCNLNDKSTYRMNICKLLNNVPLRKWEDKACMQIIGATNKTGFMRHLIISIIFQTSFMMYGRPILYLALPPSVWDIYVFSGKNNSATCVMFNILYNYKIFGVIDMEETAQLLNKNRKRKRKHKNYTSNKDDNMFYVIKLEPKPDLFTIFNGRDDIINFWHFVRHHLYKPSLRVIPALEKIIPSCGIRLIEKDYNIYTEFKHLSPNQVFDLFKEFKSWPEFKESSFLSSANDIKEIFVTYEEEQD